MASDSRRTTPSTPGSSSSFAPSASKRSTETAWYDKYRIRDSILDTYGKKNDESSEKSSALKVYSFSAHNIEPAHWKLVQTIEHNDDKARTHALSHAQKSKYRHIDNMPFFTLNNGSTLPAIGLGTWKAERGQVRSAVHIALQAGYRHIDCASVYQNEEEVGDALHYAISNGFIPREKLYVCSKVWNTDHAPDRVRASCIRSLKALKLDYLDLYMVQSISLFLFMSVMIDWCLTNIVYIHRYIGQ